MVEANEIITCKKDIIFWICKFQEYFTIITALTSIIIKNVPNFFKNMKTKKKPSWFTNNKKSIIIVALIIFIAYVPYLLNYFPGNVLIDSEIQILQSTGNIPLSNHHPVLHTSIIGLCMNIGNGIFGSYQMGAFIYTLLQTIITSLIFSYSIYYMAKKKISPFIRIIVMLFYMFCPTICVFTITMYKDIPFALSILLVTIGITEMVTNTEEFMKSKKKILALSILVTICMFFRNNGFYAIVLTFPIALIILKKYYKKILIIFLIPILFYKIISGPVYNAIGIEQGSIREALSVPIQFMARLMVVKENDLTQEQKNKINKYLPIKNFKELYQEGFADPIKSQFSDEEFEKDKMGFIKLYFDLALKYPIEAFKSFVNGSYGYYYPNTIGWGVYTGVNTEILDQYGEFNIEEKPIIKLPIVNTFKDFINTRDIPIISMFLNIGFLFWMILLCITYNIYIKQYRNILIFLPVLFIWLTTLASPVYCEPRYVYSFFTCIPIFVGTTFKNVEMHKENYLNDDKRKGIR